MTTPSGSARCECGHSMGSHHFLLSGAEICKTTGCGCNIFVIAFPAEPAGERTREDFKRPLADGEWWEVRTSDGGVRVTKDEAWEVPAGVLFVTRVRCIPVAYLALPSAPREREVTEEMVERGLVALDASVRERTGMETLKYSTEQSRDRLRDDIRAVLTAALSPSPDGVQK